MSRLKWGLLGAGALAAGAAAAVLVFGLPAGLSAGGPAQAEAETDDEAEPAEPGTLSYAELSKQTQRRPKDARAWVLKARMDVAAGRYELAAAGYAQAVAVGRKVARDPNVWIEYAEARGLAQSGRLAGEPLRLVQQALALSPTHGPALDLAGSAAWEAGDYAGAVRYWRQLQTQLAPGDERQAPLARALEKAEQKARVSLPPPR